MIDISNPQIKEESEQQTSKSLCSVINRYDEYTYNALMDVILYQISSKKKRSDEWVNLEYAYLYLHRFFLFKPLRSFEIRKSDLTTPLVERLERLDFNDLNLIMVSVVRRILEATDSYYYHVSGIHYKIKWKFID